MQTTPPIIKASIEIGTVLIASLNPSLPFLWICIGFIAWDNWTAYQLARRVKQSGRSTGKFRSRKAEKTFDTFVNALFAVVLSTYVNNNLTNPFGNLYLPNIATAWFCGVQLVSVIENQSSSNDKRWAIWVQKVFADKSPRHYDINEENMKAKKTILERLKKAWRDFISKTPKEWKRVQALCVSLGISCAAVWGINEFMNLQLHDTLITILKYVIGACAFITGRSQFKSKEEKE